jgi:alpha-L-fucosidase
MSVSRRQFIVGGSLTAAMQASGFAESGIAHSETPNSAGRAAQLKKLKWGMFICWSFSTFSDEEWTQEPKDVSFFNPSGLDTDEWARTAKEAGMGYLLFLTKHHDGFCLWDTKTTSLNVMKSPLGKDVLAAVRQSCDKYGIKLALYFSEGEWAWPDKKNREIKKAQLKELCTNYGPIEFFWMDHAQGDGGLSHQETVDYVKSIQPQCFVGFNNGDPAGDLRLGEMGAPAPLTDLSGAGPYAAHSDHNYLVAEFALPLLGNGPFGNGVRWFYTDPKVDKLARSPWELLGLYMGTVKYGNIFSLDVGPDRTGHLREIDIQTLRKAGELIRSISPQC